jgi:hypothetical protein
MTAQGLRTRFEEPSGRRIRLKSWLLNRMSPSVLDVQSALYLLGIHLSKRDKTGNPGAEL